VSLRRVNNSGMLYRLGRDNNSGTGLLDISLCYGVFCKYGGLFFLKNSSLCK
jgi:hypothetical protein